MASNVIYCYYPVHRFLYYLVSFVYLISLSIDNVCPLSILQQQILAILLLWNVTIRRKMIQLLRRSFLHWFWEVVHANFSRFMYFEYFEDLCDLQIQLPDVILPYLILSWIIRNTLIEHMGKPILLREKLKNIPNMQEPLIQKILNLTKYTFARVPTSKHGCRQRVLGTEQFSTHLSEIEVLMKQVRYLNVCLYVS